MWLTVVIIFILINQRSTLFIKYNLPERIRYLREPMVPLVLQTELKQELYQIQQVDQEAHSMVLQVLLLIALETFMYQTQVTTLFAKSPQQVL